MVVYGLITCVHRFLLTKKKYLRYFQVSPEEKRLKYWANIDLFICNSRGGLFLSRNQINVAANHVATLN